MGAEDREAYLHPSVVSMNEYLRPGYSGSYNVRSDNPGRPHMLKSLFVFMGGVVVTNSYITQAEGRVKGMGVVFKE